MDTFSRPWQMKSGTFGSMDDLQTWKQQQEINGQRIIIRTVAKENTGGKLVVSYLGHIQEKEHRHRPGRSYLHRIESPTGANLRRPFSVPGP